MNTYIYISNTGNAWKNLAVDEHLLKLRAAGSPGGMILYMYVNDSAVIIGRNQNAWRECNLKRMDEDGVQLVRRHTGGGAVYHDRGNLNFSFITCEKTYDKERQTGVIIKAVKRFGIDAEVSGRNDILTNGKKFSGNAYGLYETARSQHGTVLVNADMSRLCNYLNVSEKKIISKGVSSIRSRVCNLTEIVPQISVEALKNAIIEEFASEYGQPILLDTIPDESAVEAIFEKQRSWDWRLGKAPSFDFSFEDRLSFGEIQLMFSMKNGRIVVCSIYTDALDTEFSERISERLTGCRLEAEEIATALADCGEVAKELSAFIGSNL